MNLPRRARNLMFASGIVCSVVGGVVLWKEFIAGEVYQKADVEKKDKKSAGSLVGKFFVVTGANSGRNIF